MRTESTETGSRFGKVEQVALAFFQKAEAYTHAKSPNKIKKLFFDEGRHLDYIIMEGSLKAALLRTGIFSAEEAAYLQDDPIGRQVFCQCAEFFMNGFKLGHSALGFSVHDYIVAVDPSKPFEPLSESVVLYPESYADLYALDSSIAECFKRCFAIEGDKVSGITLWNVSYKGGEA